MGSTPLAPPSPCSCAPSDPSTTSSHTNEDLIPKIDPHSCLELSTGVEPPASTSLTFSFGEPCHRRCSVIYGAASTRWNDFSGTQPGYTTSWWSAHLDSDRRGLSDGDPGRGVAGGPPTSVVSEHCARLFHLSGAVVDLPGAARRGGQVAGSRCAGSVRFLGMAA